MKTALTITLLGLLITSYAMDNGGKGGVISGTREKPFIVSDVSDSLTEEEQSELLKLANESWRLQGIHGGMTPDLNRYSRKDLESLRKEVKELGKKAKIKSQITTNGKLDVDKLAEYLSNN
jgi:hypothetical protein